MIEIGARTGARCETFGHDGEVDTTIGIGRHDPGMFSITSAPTIVRGVIVVGHQVLDGQKRNAPSGTPPTSDRHFIEYPGYNGGSDWGGVSIDPKRGVIIANYNDMPNYNRLVPHDEANRLGWTPRDQARGKIGGPEGAGDPQAGSPYAIYVNAGWRLPVTGLLCKQPPYGGIRAIDLKTGKTLWIGRLARHAPTVPSAFPPCCHSRIGTPNNGESVVTAGGLIFIAVSTDDLIRAIDIESGKTVWTAKLPAGGQATPMTYEENGKQYLVIVAGGHHFMETRIGDEVVAYAVPELNRRPAGLDLSMGID